MKTLVNNVKKSSLAAIILLAVLFSVNASAATVKVGKETSHTEIT